VEATAEDQGVAVEAAVGTDPVFLDVTIIGQVIGEPIEIHSLTTDQAVGEQVSISFLPPPPISAGRVGETSPSAAHTVSSNVASPVPISVPGQQLFSGKSRLALYMGMIGAILVVVVLGGMLLLHNSNSQTTAPKEIERLVQEREQARTRLKEVEQEKQELDRKVKTEAERADREAKEKQEALIKLTQAEQEKVDADRRAKSKLNTIEHLWLEFKAFQNELKKQGPMLKVETRNQKIKELEVKEMELSLAIYEALSPLRNQQRPVTVPAKRPPRILVPPASK